MVPPLRRVLTGVALAAILAGHFALRRHADAVIPRHDRAFYSEHYAVAISLVAGRGFRGLDLTGEEATWPESPTVAKFLAGGKEDLRGGRLKVFLDTARSTPPPAEAYGRVLDLHTAAALWRVLGISWPVLFGFYALASTAACLGVFVLAARIGGSGAGLLAALLFAASPFEATYSAYSIRDLSPLWFAVAAFAAASAAGRVLRPVTLMAAAFFAGVTAMLGVGWRPDAILLPPFAALVLAATAVARGTPGRRTIAALAALAVGSAVTWMAIARLAGGEVRRPPTIGFHIAAYGSHTRTNLLGYENSFLAARDDTQTFFTVAHHADAVSGRPRVVYGGADYAVECRRLFLAMARSESWRWLAGFPRFYARALDALGDPASVQSIPASDLAALRPPEAQGLGRWMLDPLARALPALFMAGALIAFARARERPLVLGLLAFSGAWAAALLTVLPESKHFGPLLLPLCVLGGQVVGAGAGAARLARWRPGRAFAGAAVAVACALFVAAMAVRAIATLDRRGYLDDVARLPAGEALPAARGQRFEGPWRAPGADADPAGFVVEVEAGDAPGPLFLRQERGRPGEPSPKLHVTRHALPPRTRATLFVTALQGLEYGDIRSHRIVVDVSGTAAVVGARRVSLAGWRRPLFATVIPAGGAAGPGNPTLDRGPFATRFVNVPAAEAAARD